MIGLISESILVPKPEKEAKNGGGNVTDMGLSAFN